MCDAGKNIRQGADCHTCGNLKEMADNTQEIQIRPLVRLSDLSGIDEGKGLLQKLLEMREEEGNL